MRREGHTHVFLGRAHDAAARRTWAVIWLCAAMMALEIGGGIIFGSIALVADGLHMSTHAGALLLAALAYSYSRKHADDPRFTFGTGKLGDLAGYTSAIVLALIALFIGYESIHRLLTPVPIRFSEAIPIAVLGLLVNVGSVWLLSGGGHDHHHHGHGHGDHSDDGHDETHRIATGAGGLLLSIFEDGVPPVFRLHAEGGVSLAATTVTVETVRRGGVREVFAMVDRGDYLESTSSIPEPHAFVANLAVPGADYPVVFEEHDHGHAHSDNNMRAAIVHVVADAAVSVTVIVGLLLARSFGWLWMDGVAGIVGACVISSWAYGLVSDTGSILLDMNPDSKTTENLRAVLERDGDRVLDLHLWRMGPGHLGTIVSITTSHPRGVDFYRSRLAGFRNLSHVTIEVVPEGVSSPAPA